MSMPNVTPLDDQGAPDPVTPADSPSDQAGWDSVTPASAGPAPYNIQAPMDDLTGVFAAARQLSGGGEGAPGPGLNDMLSPRQAEARTLLDSPQGFSSGGGTSGYDILSGYSGGGGVGGWPNNVQPGQLLETPDQGTGSNAANTG